LTRVVAAPRERRQAAWAAVALLAVLAFGAYHRLTPRSLVQDLRPWPDAIEYEEAAVNLADGRGYLLWIADRAYPPRYAPGLSVLIAASLPLVGTAPGCGIWVVLGTALAAIAGTYVLARLAAGRAAGVVAALLVATSPLHVAWSRAVMSDVPASAAVAWVSAWTMATLRRRAGLVEYLALGAACGLAVSIRPPLAVLAPAACAATGLLSPGSWRARLRGASMLAAGVVLGLLPLLWLNTALFGSPLRTGYGYWTEHSAFGLTNAAAGSDAGSNFTIYGHLLAGVGPAILYPWTAALLLVAGTWSGLRRGGTHRALVLLVALIMVPFTLLHLTYSQQSVRLFVSILPPLAAVMALPCAAAEPIALRGLGVVLLVATLLIEAAHPEAAKPPDVPAFDVAALEQIAALTEPDAAILAHTPTRSSSGACCGRGAPTASGCRCASTCTSWRSGCSA
jgi:4-amino-4-deoxy-L-arabinose transferase-like glycosyltransferase